MKKITTSLFLMICSLGFAQQVLIEDFETAPPSSFTFTGFEGLGSATIAADPAAGGTRMNGLKLVNVPAGNPWQGAEIITNSAGVTNKRAIKLRTDKTIKVDVYSTKAFTMLCKVELGDGAPNSAASQAYTTPNEWQTLTFTMNQSLDGTGVANGDYGKIVFFCNWKASNDGFAKPTSEFSVYVDNIVAEKASVVVVEDPVPPTAAPEQPNRRPEDVISLFSSKYSDITIDAWSATWDDSDVFDVEVAGNATKKIKFGNFLGVDFSTPGNHKDLSEMTNFHMDIWTPTATLDKSFNIKFSNWQGGTAEANAVGYSGNNSNYLKNPNPGTWYSVDLKFSDFMIEGGGSALRNDIAQFVITSNLKLVYIDNIYAYKGEPLSTKGFETSRVRIFPNPASNSLNIVSQGNIENISLFSVLGQKVLEKSPKTNNVTLNISDLQKGIYFVKATIEGKVSTTKIVKE